MQKSVTLFILSLILVGLGWWYYQVEKAANVPPVVSSAGVWSLPDSSGKIHSLDDFKGKWVVLHFWASWCQPCLDEIPKIKKFSEAVTVDNVKVIAVSIDAEWRDALRVLPQSTVPKNMLSLLDAGKEVSGYYNTHQFPETFLVSPEQKVITRWAGAQNWESDTWISGFRQLLKK